MVATSRTFLLSLFHLWCRLTLKLNCWVLLWMTYLWTSVSYWSYPHCCRGACLSFYAHLCLFYKTESPNIQCVHCHHIVYPPDGLFPFLVCSCPLCVFCFHPTVCFVSCKNVYTTLFLPSACLVSQLLSLLKSVSDFVGEIRFWKSTGSWIFFLNQPTCLYHS